MRLHETLKSECICDIKKVLEDQYIHCIFGIILSKNRHLSTFANILLACFNSINLILSLILGKFHKMIRVDINFVILEI